MDEKLGVALLGAGRMGRIHLENLLKESRVDVVYVSANTEATLQEIHTTYNLPSCRTVLARNENAIFSDKRVKAVVIASPTGSHEHQVKHALANGMHVMCEKPLSFDDSTVEDCYRLAKSNNVNLLCGFQRIFDPSIRALYDATQDPHFGKIHVIKSCSRDNALPPDKYLKTSGGFLKDSTVHDIHMLCWIARELPTSVYAVGSSMRPNFVALNDFDTLALTLKFPSGAIGLIDQSRLASYGYDQRLEVLGENGHMLQVSNLSDQVNSLFNEQGCGTPCIVRNFEKRYKEAYQNELNHFLNLISGSENTRVTASSVVATNKIANAALESAKTNCPIKLTWSFNGNA